ncbi:hypothetical protein pipiens_005184 [Culex pipiens pipiens]|uniref:PDEase domain-containing protein n=1 Tax=Culex pipiens pipiens TaxID=38569 RepID=A0ABD1CAK7_CULPP
MDIVINPTSDAVVELLFDEIRRNLAILIVPKFEESINVNAKRKVMFLLDGTNAQRLKKSLESFGKRPRPLKKLANISTQYLLAVVNSPVTKDHEFAFKATTSCHILLVDISTSPPQYHRLTPVDKRHLTFPANSSPTDVLDDRRDWRHYEVRIQTIGTRPPYATLANVELTGLDIEVCKAVFGSARIRYRFVMASNQQITYSSYRARVEHDLASKSIDMIISRAIFANAFAEHMYVYDKIGLCLVLPKSLSRNVVYHLVHPFQLNIWLLILAVLCLDLLLVRFYPSTFPNNLVIRYMTVTRYTPDMRSVNEVLKSDLQFKVPVGTKQQMAAENAVTDIHHNMLGRLIEVENFRYDQMDPEYGYMVVCSLGETLLKQLISQEIEEFGYRAARRKFYLLEEMLDWSWRYYAVANHFTYYGRLRLVTSWINEAGLWNKWMADFGTRVSSDRQAYALWDEDSILGLEDIAAVWYLLGTGWVHRPGGVDQQVVKLLADVGYIADRLRNLERCWELAELKDLHKRIVVLLASDECPPVNVLRAIRNDQLRPLQAELHGRTQLQQEVEQAAVEARQADKVKRARWRQEVDCLNADDETAQAKLAQLEDFVVAFYRSYRDTRQGSRVRGGNCSRKPAKKVRERKVFPFLPSSSSDSSPSPTQESSSSSPANTATNKCHQQQQNKPNQTDDAEQQQSFSTSQADRTMNQDREDGDPNVASEQQQAKQPDASTNPSDDTNPSDAKQPEPTTSSNANNNTSTTKDDDEDEDVTTTNTATTTTASEQLVTVVPTVADATTDEKRPSLDGPNSSPLTSPAKSRHVAPSGDSTEPDEEEDDDDDDDNCDDGGENGLGGEVAEVERNKLRKRISELANNFASAKQFQQMCDNIDAINDAELRALIRELKRKIEFAERMNWMCLSSRPRGPPHRKTSLPKHTDVKKRFLEVAATTLPDEVKAALRLPAFDSYEWEDWDVIHLMQTMFVELNLLDKFQIPPETLREWLYEVYKHYNDVPFHNYRHCFCVAQMSQVSAKRVCFKDNGDFK